MYLKLIDIIFNKLSNTNSYTLCYALSFLD